MSEKTIETHITGGQAEVLLNRPKKLNAVNSQLTEELNTDLEKIQDNDDIDVIILSGSGRGFCSGADTDEMQTRSHTKESYRKHLWTIQNILKLLYFGPKITIAAINGPALGAGFSFAMSTDFRIMSENATLCDQHTNINLVPGGGTPYLLSEMIGESKAKELILTGKTITADEAQEMGLLTDLVSDGETLATAREFATKLQNKSSKAMENSKALFNHKKSYKEQLNIAFEYQWECLTDKNHESAIAGESSL